MKRTVLTGRLRADGELGTFECYLTYACNQRCVFCFTPGELRRSGTIPYAVLARAIRAMRRRGHTELSLLGGEPTLHPEIERIVALGRACGYKRIFTFSNGQRYSDPAFTARMKEAGLFSSYLSIHGHTPALHDGVTGVKGSFEKAVRGVSNLVAAGIPPVLICVVQKKNHRYLREYAEYFSGLGVKRFVIFFLKYQGRVIEERVRARGFLLPLSEAARSVRGMFEYFQLKAAMPPMLEHFPPCVLPGYEGRMTDYYPDLRQQSDPDYACLHPGEKAEATLRRAYKDLVYLDGCASCVYRAGCQGIDANYLKVFGANGLSPVLKKNTPFYSGWGKPAAKAAVRRFSD